MSFNDEMLENFGRELPADYDFAAEREYLDERDYDEMADAFDDFDYGDEPADFRDDVEADADALAGAGYGTDEDYGYYGEDDYSDWGEPECDLYGEC